MTAITMSLAIQNCQSIYTTGSSLTTMSQDSQDEADSNEENIGSRKLYISVPSRTGQNSSCQSPDLGLILRQLSANLCNHTSDREVSTVAMVTNMKDIAGEDVSMDIAANEGMDTTANEGMDRSANDGMDTTTNEGMDTAANDGMDTTANEGKSVVSEVESLNRMKGECDTIDPEQATPAACDLDHIMPPHTDECTLAVDQENEDRCCFEIIILDNSPENTTTDNPNVSKCDQDNIQLPSTSSSVGIRVKKIKDRKSKKRKVQGKNRKWKSVELDNFGFEFSLFPWHRPASDEVTVDMDTELKQFEEACSNNNEHDKDNNNVENKPEDQSETKLDTQTAEVQKTAVKLYDSTADCEVESFDFTSIEVNLDLYLSSKTIDMVDTFSGNIRGEVRLRHKRKWQIQKARRQIKTKHCCQVNNTAHGVLYYIHHRIAKIMSMVLERTPRAPSTSMRSIDKRWNKLQKDENFKLVANPVAQVTSRTGGKTSRPVIPRHDRPTPPPPAYALSAYNADGNLQADLVNILMGIQDRELTPEDYELLLRLDERVKPKTADDEFIESLKTVVVTEATEELCAICLEEYIIGHLRRYLPCDHYFHDSCTVQWLKNSTICPLDGLEITE